MSNHKIISRFNSGTFFNRCAQNLALFSFMLVLLFATGSEVLAHGYIIRSIPEDRATLERPPTRLQYWFSEALEPQFSELNLRDQSGNIIATGAVDENDRTLLKLQVPQDALTDGAYIVELRPAFASDGHVVVSTSVFFVGEDAGGIESTDASDKPLPLEIIWKAALFAGTTLLFGVYALYAGVLVPAWGSVAHPAGLLPPRVMSRLNGIAWVAMIVVAFASIFALMQQTMVFFNASLVQVVNDGLWQVVRVGSRFGDMWNIRIMLLIVVALMHGASLYYREKYPKTVRSFWTANAWIAALMIGLQAVNSHAAGSIVMPWIAMLVHWLHSVAVAFWLGGIVVLTLILPAALQPYAGDTRRSVLLVVMRRFSRLIVGVVAVVITSGIYNSSNWFFTPSDVATTYGASLGVKLIMVALLLFIGGLHHAALRPDRFSHPMLQRLTERVQQFNASLRLESAFVVLALITAALLSATPIPEPEFARETVTTPEASQQVGAFTVSQAIVPGGPGVNTYDTVIEQNGEPVTDAEVSIQVVQPSQDKRSGWDETEQIDSGLFVTANDAIDETGEWWTLVDIVRDGETQRAAFAWDISADASVIQSRPPSLINWLALAGVMIAVAYVMYPTAQGIYEKLDLSPVTVLVAGGMIVLTIVTLVGAVLFIEHQQRIFDATLHPPPSIINPTLPDTDSLERGGTFFATACDWRDREDFTALQRELRVIRDDALYTAVLHGWRDLPECDSTLTDAQRWDVVNYLRTLR